MQVSQALQSSTAPHLVLLPSLSGTGLCLMAQHRQSCMCMFAAQSPSSSYAPVAVLPQACIKVGSLFDGREGAEVAQHWLADSRSSVWAVYGTAQALQYHMYSWKLYEAGQDRTRLFEITRTFPPPRKTCTSKNSAHPRGLGHWCVAE